MLTTSRGMWQRPWGQTDAGSWAARITARISGTMILVVLLTWPAVAVAGAATRGQASDPAPQKAPTSGASSQPSPDPAPQASTTSPVTHRSTVTTPAIRVPVVTTPTRTAVVAPTSTVIAPAANVATSSQPPAQPARHASTPHVSIRRAPAPHHMRSQTTQLSFPLALPRDLLLLPGKALHDTSGRRDGLLLLMTSLAMAALAVASFALFRRLRRLELR